MPLLDATVFVDLMRRDAARRAAASAALSRLITPARPATTSRFTVSELLLGILRSADPVVQERKVEAVLAGVEIREFNDDAMRIYPKIAANQLRIGRPVGTMDMLIASVAITTACNS